MNYCRYTFKQLANIKYGKNQKNVLSESGSIPIYGTGGLMGYATDFLYDKPSVLIGRKGTIEKVYYVEHPFWTVDTLFYTEINDELVLPLYFYYLVSLLDLKQYNEGTTIPSLRTETLNRLEFDIPSLEDQAKVLSVLKPIEDKIKVNEGINKNLFQQAQNLFVSWFVDYEPFGGKMPDNWGNVSVYDLADYINGAAFKKTEYSDTGYPIIKIAELKNGITDSTQRCCVKKDEKYYIGDRDILFSWSGNPDTSIDTFIWSNGRAILNQHTFRVVSKFDAPAFTFFLLKYLKPQFTQIASNKQTTGLGHVTVADLKKLQFNANASAIAEFNTLVMPMFDLIYSNYKEIQQLSDLRDSLLPKLMSGELDISNLDL